MHPRTQTQPNLLHLLAGKKSAHFFNFSSGSVRGIKQNIIVIVILETSSIAVFHQHCTVADPDLSWAKAGDLGAILFCLACRLLFLRWFLLSLPKIRGGSPHRTTPIDPPLQRSVVFFLHSTFTVHELEIPSSDLPKTMFKCKCKEIRIPLVENSR